MVLSWPRPPTHSGEGFATNFHEGGNSVHIGTKAGLPKQRVAADYHILITDVTLLHSSAIVTETYNVIILLCNDDILV